MFDCDEFFTSKSDASLPPSPIYDRYQSRDGYHAVPPPYTGTFMPPKPDLVFHNAPIPKPKSNGNHKNRKACFVCKSLDHLIKDFTAVVPKPLVTRPRQAKTVVTKPYSPPRRNINRSSSPKASTFPLKVTAAKAPMGNPQHALKDKGVIDSGCSRHVTGNMSCVLQMRDKKNNVLFTGTECLVLSPEFKLPDETQVLLRVSRENNMYNVDLKNIVPSRDLTCLFVKAILDESNLWHKRLGHINFKTMNKLVKGNLVRG
nr:ribonuclease H-like domain-containing protein [Tanacetum cinerariifolium]